jgi:hypothetical protein
MTTVILAIFTSVAFYSTYTEIFTLGVVFLFILFLLTGFRYIIVGNKLYIKLWILPSGSIDIMDILSVKRTYNPLSSAAASLKRLCVRIKKRKKIDFPYFLISPVREKEFIEAIKAVNPNIYVQIEDKKGWWRISDWDI